MSDDRDELMDRIFDSLDIPAEARPVLEAHAAAWKAYRERELEWTGDMLMSIAEICGDLSAELTAALGLPIHVSFDPAPVERLVVRRTPAEWCELT